MLQAAEGLLSLLGKELRDGAARRFLHQDVGVHQLPAQAASQGLAHRGLAAARHTDQQQIAGVPLHFPGNVRHPLIGDGAALKELRRRLGLGHQHPKAVGPQQPPLLPVQQELGLGRVVD